jgi:sugar diacid utilization regulator
MGEAVAVGQSGRMPLTELHEASRQAHVALRVARGVSGGHPVAAWGTLGADRIIAQLPPGAIGDTPEPLAQMLLEEPELAETLTVFFEEGGHIKAAAERLSLHRSGLYYRLSRIESLTGLRLDRGDDRLLAHLAVRLAKL